jgi:5-methyltetrahydropteroyltriglutamate--homocysteine methyltransferase
VPRIVGPIRRRHPVQVEDLRFLRAHTDRPVKVTVPGPFTTAQQAQNDYYPSREAAAFPREAAFGKLAAMTEAASRLRRELAG